MKKLISFKLLYGLSFIPAVGLIIACVCSFINVRRTAERKHVFIHLVFLLLDIAVVAALGGLCVQRIMVYNVLLGALLFLPIVALETVVAALLCVGISQIIVHKCKVREIE